MNKPKIERKIAYLYVYLLIIRIFYPFSYLQKIVGAAAIYFDFIIHIFGITFMILNSKGTIRLGKTGKIIKYFIGLIFYLNVSSLVMAFLFHKKLGMIDGEDSFTAITSMIIYYMQYVFIIIYNNYIMKFFDIKKLKQIFKNIINFLMVIGYTQIFIYFNIGLFVNIYDKINILKIFNTSSYIQLIKRIPLTGSEPASAGVLIGMLVIPFLFSELIERNISLRKIITIVLWLPIIYFTKSSTCYILIFLDTVIFIFLYIKNKGITYRQIKILFFIFFLIVIAVIILFLKEGMDNILIKEINYLLLKKIQDRGNESSVTRTIPTYINLKIFLNYPLFGVGNGNQGFFYKEYFPVWGEISSDTFNKIQGVADGGVFIPSLLSGYGIVGTVAFMVYFYKIIKYAKRNKGKLGSMYYMFIMAFVVFIFNGFQTDNIGCYYIWFIMSIPFMTRCTNFNYRRKYYEKIKYDINYPNIE